MKMRHLLLPLLLLLPVLIGCGEQEIETYDPMLEGLDSVDTKLVTYHPILDADVRSGDSLVLDLARLVKAGVVLDSDMPMIGAWVRERGGMERADSAFAGMSYRDLLDRALLLDLSDGAPPCDECTDSLLVTLPNSRARLFAGMARRPLDSMIVDAFAGRNDPPAWAGSDAWGRAIDTTDWDAMSDTITASSESTTDVILYRLVIARLAPSDERLADYRWSDIAATVEALKSDPDATPLISALASLTEG